MLVFIDYTLVYLKAQEEYARHLKTALKC